MKGYDVDYGYMGYIPCLDQYVLFATEREYAEIYRKYDIINKEEN